MTATPVRPSTVDGELFRRLHAAGVVVVTAPGDPPAGFTATSFTSVSLDPPLVAFSLSRTASAWPAVSAADHVAVHVLSARQERVARTFATSGIDRFAAHGDWRTGPEGVPLLGGALVQLVCRVAGQVTAGDHTIVLATPLTGGYAESGGRPLLYHQGGYADLQHRWTQ
ncbi:flavin reductase family protein [Asanoa siamensis]|uniref:Flavin-dependent reductase n=1 Tax=Asanoa siamensis TaxID=926357 RepID=A0ABQ4CYL0_9ACTN|nr:flavin reductase family protein [Asanoa siamensis]GIF75922.1 flavin-dependent reductase [Asanoa siamensis]